MCVRCVIIRDHLLAHTPNEDLQGLFLHLSVKIQTGSVLNVGEQLPVM